MPGTRPSGVMAMTMKPCVEGKDDVSSSTTVRRHSAFSAYCVMRLLSCYFRRVGVSSIMIVFDGCRFTVVQSISLWSFSCLIPCVEMMFLSMWVLSLVLITMNPFRNARQLAVLARALQ
jgi:hypothetical protein